MLVVGVDCSELYQGEDEERTVHRYFIKKQYGMVLRVDQPFSALTVAVRTRFSFGWRVQSQ